MAKGYSTDDPWRNAMVGMNFLGNAMRTGQQIGEARYEQDERDAVNKAYEYIAGKVGTGDISALGNDPILFTRHGAQATSKFMDDRLKTESSRLQMLKNKDEANDHLYRDTLRPLAFKAQEAFKKNDMQLFGQIAGELSAKFPFPYRYNLGQDGNFIEEFRSSKAGKFIDTGERMTPQQVMDSINRMMAGEQRVLRGANMEMQYVNPDFLAAAARYQLGTIADNAAALGDSNRYITLTKNGHTIHVVPQNRHDDYSGGVNWMVLDDSGKMGGMYGSLEDLYSQGYRRLDVQAKDAQLRRIIAGPQKEGGTGLGNSAMTDALLRAGYTYDKTYKRWFKTVPDENGKLVPDMTKPLTQAEYNEIVSGLGGDDPLGILPPKTNPGTKTGSGEDKGEVKLPDKQTASGNIPGTVGSASASNTPIANSPAPAQKKERILPPKGSVWERMPEKYEAYTKVFGKRPDSVKPAIAVKKLDAELERRAEEKLREGMDMPNWWEADMRQLGPEGALKPAIEKMKQFIMDEILTSTGYYSSRNR